MILKKWRKEAKEDKRRVILMIFLTSAILLVCITAFMIFVPCTVPLGRQEIDMHLTVGNHTGFNVNTSALFFGTLMRSSASTREIAVTNVMGEKLKAQISKSGELSVWTKISEESFILQPYENRTVKVTLSVPDYAGEGDYSGKITIDFAKA